jgi:hypothetical protein
VRLTAIDKETEMVKSHLTLSLHQLQMILDIVRYTIHQHQTDKILLDDKDHNQRIEIFVDEDEPSSAELGDSDAQ